MSILFKIEEIEKELLAKSKEAATQSEINKVIEYARLLEEVTLLKQDARELMAKINNLDNCVRNNCRFQATQESSSRSGRVKSSKLIAKEEREKLVKELEHLGFSIKPDSKHSQVYHTNSGILGVPFATELERFPSRWFFGLPKLRYSSIIFICATLKGEIIIYILPQKIVTDNLAKFSVDNNGQVKFNLLKKGTKMEISIPSGNNIDISLYKNNYDLLR